MALLIDGFHLTLELVGPFFSYNENVRCIILSNCDDLSQSWEDRSIRHFYKTHNFSLYINIHNLIRRFCHELLHCKRIKVFLNFRKIPFYKARPRERVRQLLTFKIYSEEILIEPLLFYAFDLYYKNIKGSSNKIMKKVTEANIFSFT